MSNPFLIITLLAGVMTFLMAMVLRTLARRIGFVDKPDGHRKMHSNSVALGGGVAVLFGFLIALAFGAIVQPEGLGFRLSQFYQQDIALVVSAVLMCLVGLFDDKFSLRGRQKLMFQFFIVTGLMFASDVFIKEISFFGYKLDLGLISTPVTILWMLLAINSMNLIDGLDGLATSLGSVMVGSFAVLSLMTNHPTQAVVAFALLGALLGFIPFNRPPAKMYLGDAGSMTIGLLLGYLAITSSMKGPTTVVISIPLAIWTIPLMDTGMAIIRRKLQGRSIYSTDRGHIHHSIQRYGWKQLGTLAIIILGAMVAAAGTIYSVYLQSELLAMLSASAVISTMIVTGLFGWPELELLSKRGFGVIKSLIPTINRSTDQPKVEFIKFQGTYWRGAWKEFTEHFEHLNLHSVSVDVNIPWLHEAFAGNWARRQRLEPVDCIRVSLPCRYNGKHVGHFRVSFRSTSDGPSAGFRAITSLVELWELEIAEIVARASEKSEKELRPVAESKERLAEIPA